MNSHVNESYFSISIFSFSFHCNFPPPSLILFHFSFTFIFFKIIFSICNFFGSCLIVSFNFLVYAYFILLNFVFTYLDNIINFNLMMVRHEPKACLINIINKSLHLKVFFWVVVWNIKHDSNYNVYMFARS